MKRIRGSSNTTVTIRCCLVLPETEAPPSERAAEDRATQVRRDVLSKKALMQWTRKLPFRKGKLWREMTPGLLREGKSDSREGKHE